MASRSRADTSSTNAPDPALPLERQARRRLIGAGVLVLVVGVLFSLFFDAEPRGARDEVQVRIPSREAAGSAAGGAAATVAQAPPALGAPGSPTDGAPAAPTAGGVAAAGAQAPSSAASGQAAEQRLEPAAEPPPAGPAVAEPVPPAPVPPPLVTAPKADAAPAKADAAPAKADAAARPAAKTAQAEAKPDAKADGKSGGYFLQVGAFASDKAATDQVERIRRLGATAFKETTRTQQGERIRVRLGPYPTREAADPVRNRLRAAGIDVTLVAP